MEAFVGFDSAWAGNTNGAICYAVFAGDTLVKVGLPRLSDFADAVRMIKRLEKECDDVLIAIDQPIIVPNCDSGRPVDTVAKSLMGRLGGAAQTAKRSGKGSQSVMFGNSAIIWKFIARIGPSRYCGRTTDSDDNRAFVDFEAAKTATNQTHLIEVYPALALPGLECGFKKGDRAAKYNPAKRSFSPDDWRRVCNIVESCAGEIGLKSLSEWASEMVLPWDSPEKPRKLHQDKIDAALCLMVALQWRRHRKRYGLTVIGNLASGYIVTPMGDPQTSTYMRSILEKACNK